MPRVSAVIPAYNGQADNYVSGLPWLNAKVLIDQLPDALPFPVSKKTSVWRRFATQEFAKAWTGEETVAEVSGVHVTHDWRETWLVIFSRRSLPLRR